jgi:cytochrome bd-type quinol oxidase subunit 2
MAVAGGTRFHGGGKSVDAVAEPRIAARWFSLPNFYFLWPVPVVTALTALAAWHWLSQGREVRPFLAAITLFMLGYLGLVISNFPYLVPPSLTVWDTARRASEPDIHAARHAAAIAVRDRLRGNDLLAVPR